MNTLRELVLQILRDELEPNPIRPSGGEIQEQPHHALSLLCGFSRAIDILAAISDIKELCNEVDTEEIEEGF